VKHFEKNAEVAVINPWDELSNYPRMVPNSAKTCAKSTKLAIYCNFLNKSKVSR